MLNVESRLRGEGAGLDVLVGDCPKGTGHLIQTKLAIVFVGARIDPPRSGSDGLESLVVEFDPDLITSLSADRVKIIRQVANIIVETLGPKLAPAISVDTRRYYHFSK